MLQTRLQREPAADIGALAGHFVQRLSRELGRSPPALSPAAVMALNSHIFVGNVRELRAVIERTLIHCQEPVVEPAHLALEQPLNRQPPSTSACGGAATWELPVDLGELERLAINEALRRVDGNRTHAARLLGISLRTLRNKLKAWRVDADSAVPVADMPRPIPACQEHDKAVAQPSQ